MVKSKSSSNGGSKFGEANHEIRTEITEGWPSYYSAATLGNYTRVIWKGFRGTLQPEDLLPLQRRYSTQYCWEALRLQWDQWKAGSNHGADQQTIQSPEGQSSSTSAKTKARATPMCMTLMSAFWGFIALSSVLEIIFDVVRLAPVYVLGKLISFVGSEEPLELAYQYCAMLFVNNLVMAFLLNWLIFICCCGGAQIRSALISAIYHKSLRISHEAGRQHTSGDLLNMMSVDVDNVFDFAQYSTLIWGGFVRILSSLAVIWWYLGPSCLAGLFVIIAFVPLTIYLSNAIARSQNLQMNEKDKRLDTLSEIFSGIKTIKLCAWEVPFIDKVEKIRKLEANLIRRYLYGQSAISFVWYCSPFLVTAAAFGTFVAVNEENVLTPQIAFISLFLFNNMRFSLTFLPMNVTMLLKSIVCLRRISSYLLLDDIRRSDISHELGEGEDIRFQNVNVSWGETTPILSNLNFTVKTGELVAVVGRVGAGKTSLLNAILGETKKLSGSLAVRSERIAFVPQQAWIQNETIRQNILFTAPFSSDWYKEVIGKCCLESDLKLFPAGDMAEVGEKGVNLSGGQKQRISVARAVYQKAKIYLLDDPLSAVDAHVSSDLFDGVIGPHGLLKDSTRVLVTHSVQVLPFVDRIFILDNGKITHSGTYEELVQMDIPLKTFLAEAKIDNDQALSGSDSDLRASRTLSEASIAVERAPSVVGVEVGLADPAGTLTQQETVAVGGVKWAVYLNILRNFGFTMSLLCLIGFTAYRVADVLSTVWLSEWANDAANVMKAHRVTGTKLTANDSEILREIGSNSAYRISVYLGYGGAQALSVMVGAICLAIGCLSASTRLHSEMLWSIMTSPMRFFDSTPVGRVINRFGKDVNVLDVELFVHLDAWLDSALQVIATIVLVVLNIPLFIVVVFPISIVYLLIQRLYTSANRQFRRLLSITRSPVLSNFSETLSGVSSIRAYGAQDHFIQKCQTRVDLNQNCYFHSMVSSRWAALRIDLISAIITAILSCLVTSYRDTLSSGVAGMLLSYALLVCDAISWLIRVSTDVEAAVVAAERVTEYTSLEREAAWQKDDGPVIDGNWPYSGEITFIDYSTRYREGIEEVLKEINLEIHCGEKVAIVGRTGAGKSSLTLALFRILEATKGKIVIDGVDISELGLHDLRGRLTMIPQDPVLFKGSLRSNLDPHNTFNDEQLRSALEKAHSKNTSLDLQFEVSEAGKNLSVGERQLICLARALLRKSKVLVLDEATAAVDLQTDALVQDTIRRDFGNCTIITIAHRLHTVIDYDKVVVMDSGRFVEVGAPKRLIEDNKTHFYSIAKDAGLV